MTNHPKRGRRSRLLKPLTHVVQQYERGTWVTLAALPNYELAAGYARIVYGAPCRVEPITKPKQ